MRILHLLSQHPESTGSGFYLQNILRQAERHGHENFLVAGHSPGPHPALPAITPAHYRHVDFAVTPLDFPIPGMSDVMPYPSSRFQDLSTRQLADYSRVWRESISAAADRWLPDIIHSHHLWLMSSMARRVLPELPMVTSCHSTDLRQLVLCPHLQEPIVAGCRGIDRVLALSRNQAAEIVCLHQRPAETIDIVGAGYDDTVFCQPEQKRVCAPIHLLYAGKLSYAKGVDCLLKAFAQLARTDSGIQLHIAGSGTGPETEHCLALAEGLGSSVTVHGHIDQQALAHMMRACHIFVLPSLFEGLPLVLLEALACGCRLVTTGLSGCLELLEKTSESLALTVPLPTMKTIDEAEPDQIPSFVANLVTALSAMVKQCRQTPIPDPDQIAAVTEPYRWQKLFLRIEHSYRLALQSKSR